MKKIAFLSFATSALLMAGGYKIPENSTNAVALGAANIAHNHNNADAAYYNPAKMVFMSDENHVDANLMYIGLDKVKYKGTVSGTGPYDIASKKETFIVPSLHYVSPKLGNARVGVSIVSPGGLSKRWSEAPASTSTEEFTLKTIEVNPTIAVKVSETLGLAAGFRIVRSDGIVKGSGGVNIPALGGAGTVSRDMKGNGLDFGFNLAVAYQPTKNIEIGVTYRSKIDLNLEGNAKLATSLGGGSTYDGPATVSVPLPAALNVAFAYTFETKTTLEMVYERTYWSAYQNLDFNYNGTEGAVLSAIFGNAVAKNWKDTNTYRFGITQELDSVTLMGGLVIDNTPVPDSSLSFELPDTDTVAVSFGGRYKLNDKMDIALAAIYSMHDKRTINASNNNNNLTGEFSGGNVLIVSTGISYKF